MRSNAHLLQCSNAHNFLNLYTLLKLDRPESSFVHGECFDDQFTLLLTDRQVRVLELVVPRGGAVLHLGGTRPVIDQAQRDLTLIEPISAKAAHA
ncbi:hypothetical protein Spb1_27700 [Planctopirus ephydatiae]|uniref:Uncharacterized protein n=1 Tax=Planctopirus ephydatiae TaxID=2528019 RepID=A0A518GQE0_9PLAN|nr:hypothetical protein Spb1_27700 [Planctopirus ephydatiae]